MATGRLGTTSLTGGVESTVYTVPAGFYTVLNVSFTNTTMTSVTIRLAMASTSTPAASEYIEYDTVIVPNGVFERTGLVMQAGLNLVAVSNSSNVNVNVYGIETSVS